MLGRVAEVTIVDRIRDRFFFVFQILAMSTFTKYWRQGNTKRWVCVSSAIVLPITLIGIGVLLEYILRTVSTVDSWILS